MKHLWTNKLMMVSLAPFIILKGTTFPNAIYYTLALTISIIISLLIRLVVRYIFRTLRGQFYGYFLLAILVLYIFNILYNPIYLYLGLDFFEYIILICPIFLFIHNSNDLYKNYRSQVYSLGFILIIFLLSSLIRSFFSFTSIDIFKFKDIEWVIPINKFLEHIGVNLENSFFYSPAGGLFIVGIIYTVLYAKLKEKYDG